MGDETKIAWCHHTFNPWIGCLKVSTECKNCYAENLVKRSGKNLWGPVATTDRRVKAESGWRDPLRWHRAAVAAGERRRVFCGSLMDFFEDHPTANRTRPRVWELIHETPALDWLLLTKRPENIKHMVPEGWNGGWGNVWLGTSIGIGATKHRTIPLTFVPAVVHFISAEPLLEDIADRLDLSHIEWVIIGGESGPGYRQMETEWARKIVAKCRAEGVAPFFKQSAAPRTEMGIELDGQIVREYPRLTRPTSGTLF